MIYSQNFKRGNNLTLFLKGMREVVISRGERRIPPAIVFGLWELDMTTEGAKKNSDEP